MSKKIAIYTCITGSKDTASPFDVYEDEFDYFVFTDGIIAKPNERVTIKDLVEVKADNIRTARWHKTMAHKVLPDYETSIWLDGNIVAKNKIAPLTENLKYCPFVCFSHPEGRKCIYDEYKACTRLKKDKKSSMDNQIDRYRAEGYPENNGLIMTGILIRQHHNGSVVKAMEAWWAEIENGSIRDQLSFNYVAHKMGFVHAELQEMFLQHYFRIGRHAVSQSFG